MKETMGVHDVIQAVASIVQQQGQHDFPTYHFNDDVRSATLCGLTVYIRDGRVIRLHARDMDLVFEGQLHKSANDEQIVSLSDYTQFTFVYGGAAQLEGWYKRLSQFQSVFRFQPYVVVNNDEVA